MMTGFFGLLLWFKGLNFPILEEKTDFKRGHFFLCTIPATEIPFLISLEKERKQLAAVFVKSKRDYFLSSKILSKFKG